MKYELARKKRADDGIISNRICLFTNQVKGSRIKISHTLYFRFRKMELNTYHLLTSVDN
jgi:hypothetical protein